MGISTRYKFPPHISYIEMVQSDTASRRHINNIPNDEQHMNLVLMANWLETLRDDLRKEHARRLFVVVNSGFRSPELNRALGGSRTSAHLDGLAADIRVPGMTTLALARFISDRYGNYDQLIHQFGRWVHIALDPKREYPRVQDKTAFNNGRKVTYKDGILPV